MLSWVARWTSDDEAETGGGNCSALLGDEECKMRNGGNDNNENRPNGEWRKDNNDRED